MPLSTRLGFSKLLLRSERLQLLHQLHRIRPNQLIHLVSPLEEQERGHRADAQLSAHLGQLVDVKLDKVDSVLEGLFFG